MKSKEFIDSIIYALKDTESANGIKLRNFLKRNSNALKNYSDTEYYGCSQEGMNSHYYTSRLAKLPMKTSYESIEIILKIIEV